MSGHSKWANIKHKKARSDEKRGKEFTKIGKEIALASRLGGGDPDSNARLKLMIQKAKAINMPNDNINRAIKKGQGDADGDLMEELFYEGYAPGGVAVILEIATDNRNRTASDIRHLFSKYGGNLGESGCVSWMFDRIGSISVPKSSVKMDLEDFLMFALDCGAEDVKEEDEEYYEVITAMDQLMQVVGAMESEVMIESADLIMQPQNMMDIADEELAGKILKLVDVLEDHDDVQNLYANFSIPDEIMEKF